VEELRRTLEHTPKPAGAGHTTWLTRTLHAHIAPLPAGTRLPPVRELAKHLKDLKDSKGLKCSHGTVNRAYACLRAAGQLTSEFGGGTWVADPGAPLDQAAGSGGTQAAAAALPESGHLEAPGPRGVAAAEPPPSSGAAVPGGPQALGVRGEPGLEPRPGREVPGGAREIGRTTGL
jgi:hypothetical protein